MEKLTGTDIFMPTIFHSGTWFLAEFLSEHPDVKGMVQLNTYPEYNVKFGVKPNGGKTILHTHFSSANDVNVLGGFWSTYDIVSQLVSEYPTIVPVRNPLSVLLSNYYRDEKHKKYFHIIDCFEFLGRHDEAFYLPIDIYGGRSVSERADILAKVHKHIGLNVDNDSVKKWSVSWPVINGSDKTHPIPYKDLKRLLPDECAYLEKSSTITPFLERLGYN